MTIHTSHQKISTVVNLYESPKPRTEITQWVAAQPQESTVKTYMTVGDLHASTLRLVTHLAHGKIATVNEESYRDLKRVLDNYADGKRSAELLKKDFDAAMAALTIQQENTIGFRSIGDNLADRDVNDYFILKLYARIKNKKILYSNHDAFFMLNSELFLKTSEAITEWVREFKEEYPRLVNQHRSFLNLAQWVADGVVQSEELKPLIDDYRSALHLLDYDVDLVSNHISLYSHAPIDFEVITSLAKHFGIQYRDDKIADLCKTIDAINAKFQEALQTNPEQARAIYQQSNEPRSYKNTKNEEIYPIYENNAISNIIWSRPREVVYGPVKYENSVDGLRRDKLYLPNTKKNYQVTFIHGHVGPDNDLQTKNFFGTVIPDAHYFNTDTNNGKWYCDDATKQLLFSSRGKMNYYLATNDYTPTQDTQPHLLASTAECTDDKKAEQECCLSRCCAALFSYQNTQKPVGVSRAYSTMPSC